MAIFHFSAKTVSRGDGRSSTGAAAYRAAERIVDEKTGEIHDYTRKTGVLGGRVFLPGGGTLARADLWNRVEKKHNRADAIVAREFIIALPDELTQEQRSELVFSYGQELADTYGIGVDTALHAPSEKGDQRNYHTHVLMSACYVSPQGDMGKKCVELDPIHCNRAKIKNAVDTQRERWAELCNLALERAGSTARIDHRSNAERGIETPPGWHEGPAVRGILDRGEESFVSDRMTEKTDALIAIARAQASAAAAELAEESAWAQAAQAIADAAAADQQARQQRAEADAAAAAQADADAAAAKAEAERRKLAHELAEARKRHTASEQALAKAVRAEAAAEARADALRPARDAAHDGQRQAGASIFKSTQAAFKLPGWLRAIDAYDRARTVLKSAQAAVQQASQAVARAWAQVLGLDPVERERQAAAQVAQAEARAAMEREQKDALAKRQAERFTKPGQRPDRPTQAPLYEHSRQSDEDKDRNR
jgi:hypothetical protein